MKKNLFYSLLLLLVTPELVYSQTLGTRYEDNYDYQFLSEAYITDPSSTRAGNVQSTNYRQRRKPNGSWQPDGAATYRVPEDYRQMQEDQMSAPIAEQCPDYPLRLTDLRTNYRAQDSVSDDRLYGIFQDCHFELERSDCFEDLAYGQSTSEEMQDFLNRIDCGPNCRTHESADREILCRDESDVPDFRVVREDNTRQMPKESPHQEMRSYGMIDPNNFPGSSIAIKTSPHDRSVNGSTVDRDASGIRANQYLNLFIPFSSAQQDYDTNIRLTSTQGDVSINEDQSFNFVRAKENLVKDRLRQWAHQRQQQGYQGPSGAYSPSEFVEQFFSPGSENQHGLKRLNFQSWRQKMGDDAPETLGGPGLPPHNNQENDRRRRLSSTPELEEYYRGLSAEVWEQMQEIYEAVDAAEIGLCLRFDPVRDYYSPALSFTPNTGDPQNVTRASTNSSRRNGQVQSRLQRRGSGATANSRRYQQAFEYGHQNTGEIDSSGNNIYEATEQAPALDCPMADWGYSKKDITSRQDCTGEAPGLGGNPEGGEVEKSDRDVDVTPPPEDEPTEGLTDSKPNVCRCFDETGNKLYEGDRLCYGWSDERGSFYYFIDCANATAERPTPFTDPQRYKVHCNETVMFQGQATSCCEGYVGRPALARACRERVEAQGRNSSN